MGGKRKTLLRVAAMLVLCGGLSPALADGPDVVELDSLANLYEPVSFDHAMHVELTDSDCAECHHHTTGTQPTDPVCLKCHRDSREAEVVACRDCHAEKRFSAEYLTKIEADAQLYHEEKPGLKGAYHQNCLECHERVGAPTGCQDCHPRNEQGDAFFRAGKFAPETDKKLAQKKH